MAGQGSNRQYFRIIGHDGDTVIGVIGTSRDEDHAFVYLAQHFQLRQLPVPQILAVSDDELCYLQTDLGGTSLFDAIKGGRDAADVTIRKRRNSLRKPFVNFRISRFAVQEDWIGRTAIRSQNSM